MEEIWQVALDGPSGAGKSTAAKALAARLGFLYLDTGAMYRTVGLAALRAGVDPMDEAALSSILPGLQVRLSHLDGAQHINLNGQDVTGLIRTPEVSAAASAVGKWPAVRQKLVELQRQAAGETCVVVDGRDIGTHVLPHAFLKVYITASAEERARRRCLELRAAGEDVDEAEVLRQIQARDEQDMNRAVAPLRRAPDAVVLDTTHLAFEEVVDALERLVRDRQEEVRHAN